MTLVLANSQALEENEIGQALSANSYAESIPGSNSYEHARDHFHPTLCLLCRYLNSRANEKGIFAHHYICFFR